MKKVWFITGASKGLGLSLVRQLLKSGYSVAATSRNLSQLEAAVGSTSNQFLPLAMDLGNEADVQRTLNKAHEYFGRLDVVVNNAGYGQLGVLEELSAEEVANNFNINVFGLLHVVRNAMPLMRAQGRGHIINIASVAGFTGNFPGWGIYCATKFAVHGLTESLAAEIEEFGLHATIVSPGYFRTEFLNASSLGTPQHENPAYTRAREIQRLHQEEIKNHQLGDPDKAAVVIQELAEMEQPPLHVFLGEDAYRMAQAKMEAIQKDLEQLQELATSTNISSK